MPKRVLGLEKETRASFWAAINFLTQQYDDRIRAWGTEPGGPPDVWTTAQVISLLSSLSDIPAPIVEGGLTFIVDNQNLDGSWGSATYSAGGDVPASSYAVMALLDAFGPTHLSVQRGLEWLTGAYQQGWKTIPQDLQNRFTGAHYYSTAMALRALIRAPRLEIRSMCIQDAISFLVRAQNQDGGWGVAAGRDSDVTFTSYVLHGLIDALLRNPATAETTRIRRALKWLAEAQSPEGCWSDWHGVQKSPEATAYAIYSLCRISAQERSLRKMTTKGVAWLLAHQQDDGGWLFDAHASPVSNNWVTFSVACGLRAYLTQVRKSSSPKRSGARLSLVDVDSIALTNPTPQASESSAVAGLPQYMTCFPDQLKGVPLARPLDHTMFEAIDQYVKQKIPETAINEVMNAGGRIELHEIYPAHFSEVAKARSWDVTELDGFKKPPTKRLNFVRPRFFRGQEDGKERLWVAVTPGRDYFYHYGLMVRHVVSLRTIEWARYMSLYRYPHAERAIMEWTGIRDLKLAKEDLLIVGYVEAVESELSVLGSVQFIDECETPFYLVRRLKVANRTVTLLGVKFSFWGSIAGLLAQAVCEAGCTELVYIGKLGALTEPAHIYERIFCPSRFIQLRHAQVDFEGLSPPNHILEAFPELDSGLHVSVPTVLEEDYAQRGRASELKAQSIDNEIASMAAAISAWNLEHGSTIGFTCLHFATDYIRHPQERGLETKHDLGRDKLPEARSKKANAIKKIVSQVLHPFLAR